MKGKQIFLAVVLTIALLLVVFTMLKREEQATASSEASIGKELIKNMPINEVQQIKIKGPKSGEVAIAKNEDLWVVASLYNYPADFEKIREFISEMAELKNIQNVEVGKSNLSRLNLEINEGSESGTSVELFGKGGEKIAAIIVGKEHKKKSDPSEGQEYEFTDGRYVLVQGKNDVHVVDKTLNKAENPSKDWLNRDFISANNLKKASLEQDGQTKWTVSRKRTEDLMTPQTQTPNEHEIDKDKMSSIANSLYTIRFASVADPTAAVSETGLDAPCIFRAETFNGKKYELRIGKQKDNARYVKVAVSYSPPPEDETVQKQPSNDDQNAKEEKEKKDKERAEELKKAEEEANSEQEKFGKWIYLIAEASLKAMLSTEEELFKKIEKKEDGKNEQAIPQSSAPVPIPEDDEVDSGMTIPPLPQE